MTARIDRLRQALTETDCDAFVSVFPPDNQYLSGLQTSFEEISSGIVVTPKEAHFLCDFRYTEQAREEVQGFEIQQIDGDLLTRLGERLCALDVQRPAYASYGFTVEEFSRLANAYKGEFTAANRLVAELRLRKEPGEIETIRAASNLAEGVLHDMLPKVRSGVHERDIAAEFEFEFKKRGASGASFGTIALWGPRSSLPHGIPGDTKLADGDVVLLDFGCRLSGYCSDLTRTFACGTIPGAWFEEIYQITLNAQQSALRGVRPGAVCRDVDAVARGIITDAGYGNYFGHGLGHGVGIEIHEAPRLNKHSEVVLEPGMVVTVEPGIYLPGKGGVRIEDLVVVTSDGCDVLTRTPKELRVLGA